MGVGSNPTSDNLFLLRCDCGSKGLSDGVTCVKFMSTEPDLNQRPKDSRILLPSLQSSALPTELSVGVDSGIHLLSNAEHVMPNGF